MRKFRVEEIFKPCAFPEHTYITSVSSEFPYSYEFRLQQSLSIVGYLTLIIGPSKSGKTVLCEKVVGSANIISITENDFKHSHSFWGTIASHIGLSLEREMMQKNQVIDYFRQNGLVLVLDDFHLASEDMQFDIAYQLKDAIRKGFKAIVTSLPHHANDVICKNPDLIGRVSFIHLEPWHMEDLKKIAVEGFRKLDIQITDEIAAKFANRSLSSPHLMQSICLEFGVELGLNEGCSITEVEGITQVIDDFKRENGVVS